MKQLDIAMTYMHFPVSIGRYFRRALERMGHQVWSAGYYSPVLPQAPHKDYSKYLDIPHLKLSSHPVQDAFAVLAQCPFSPDLILTVNAGQSLVGAKDTGIPNALVLTDPHALPQFYLQSVEEYDRVFCMQDCYAKPYKTQANGLARPVWWLPYAADDQVHRWLGGTFADARHQVCFLSNSLNHPKRFEAIGALASYGVDVDTDVAILFDEYNERYNNSIIALNWSTEQDLPARFFEGLAQRRLVMTNRVPDLALFDDLKEDAHYVAFDTVEEMNDKAAYYLTHLDAAWQIASNGWAAYWAGNHTYLRRAEMVLDVLFPKTETDASGTDA